MKTIIATFAGLLAFLTSVSAMASGGEEHGHEEHALQVFVFVIALLFAARLGGRLANRIKQPAVLGELLAGVAVGALGLLQGSFGNFVATTKSDPILHWVAMVGVILLLFKSGLEENIHEMKEVGGRATLVAVVGVVLPVAGGIAFTYFLLPGHSMLVYVFFGATLAATSVGITAAVFDNFKFKSTETRIVLGAAVVDDIIGLVILGVLSAVAQGGEVSGSFIAIAVVKAVGFLGISILLGRLLAPSISKGFSRLHSGPEMKMALALVFCGIYAYGAKVLAGLEPIVGAFAAGLVLDAVHFEKFEEPEIAKKLKVWAGLVEGKRVQKELELEAEHAREGHVEDLIEGMTKFFVPIFFIVTGMAVDLRVFKDPQVLLMAGGLTIVAFVGKYACGFAAGKGTNKSLVGFGMVPRGEVGLIFANLGKSYGVLDEKSFAIAVVVVIATTFVAPPLIAKAIRKSQNDELPETKRQGAKAAAVAE
ncbi:MAG: cation:proton antiporter [Candidatus Gracilibacteria bacterium]